MSSKHGLGPDLESLDSEWVTGERSSYRRGLEGTTGNHFRLKGRLRWVLHPGVPRRVGRPRSVRGFKESRHTVGWLFQGKGDGQGVCKDLVLEVGDPGALRDRPRTLIVFPPSLFYPPFSQ